MSPTPGDAALQSHHASVSIARPARACLGAILQLATALARAADAGISRRRQRRALAELNDHLLRDIGLSRDDVGRACEKSFWSN
jgi:uncharacterized protein YjiS (DUF1127 family)